MKSFTVLKIIFLILLLFGFFSTPTSAFARVRISRDRGDLSVRLLNEDKDRKGDERKNIQPSTTTTTTPATPTPTQAPPVDSATASPVPTTFPTFPLATILSSASTTSTTTPKVVSRVTPTPHKISPGANPSLFHDSFNSGDRVAYSFGKLSPAVTRVLFIGAVALGLIGMLFAMTPYGHYS